jgi:6-pyruvoyltetrahydropterin/6-carboxytetrahydropterin synthase
MTMIGVSRSFKFEAAHKLPHYVGKCADLHGHTYTLRVTVQGDSRHMDKSGIIIDFGTLKKVVNETIIEPFDHKYLNDFFAVPSAETMVAEFFKRLEAAFYLAAPHVKLVHVRLWEGAGDNWAEVRNDD